MPKKAHTEEQIVAVLRQGEGGEKVADICRKVGDPSPSWSVENGPSMSTEWINLRDTEATVEVGLADSTQSAGKPLTWGSSGAG